MGVRAGRQGWQPGDVEGCRDVLVLGSVLFVWPCCSITAKREREGRSPLLPVGFRGANPQWGGRGMGSKALPHEGRVAGAPERGSGGSRCRQGRRRALPAAGREHMERIWV